MIKDVCLVSLPYSSITTPSISLGVLETYITQYGYSVEAIYGNVKFASIIGLAEYDLIDSSFNDYLIGEWTFSRAAFPDADLNDEGFFRLFTDLDDEKIAQLKDIRNKAESFIEEIAQDILKLKPKILGCTSTFQQNCASLALMRKIKDADPSIITMLGGANCEGIMGQTISEHFHWVDYVFSGECDDVIGPFIDKLMKGEHIDYRNLPNGFISQKHKSLTSDLGCESKPPRAYISDMSVVGMPIYDSYFNTLKALELEQYISPGLLAETSRGCWWGAKQHCTFCGLNGGTMTHRSKPADVAIKEFDTLSSKYNTNKFLVVDNILPVEYMKTVLPELSKDKEYNLFYETKANLKKHHVETLSKAGIKWIQPGIEGLHDDFLKAIKKGTTAIQNIAALKWCRSYGIRVTWNLLCEAPFEQEHWYEEMLEWLPMVTHLHPPFDQMAKICYHRFSPYFNNPDQYGLTLEPTKSYQYIYPLQGKALSNIAYFFNQASDKTERIYTLNFTFKPQSKALGQVQTLLDNWSEQWQSGTIPMCYMVDKGESIIIMDTREVATNFTHILTGTTAELYRLAAEPIPKERLIKKLLEIRPDEELSHLEQSITWLIENKLMISLSKCLMALAFVGESPTMLDNNESPGGSINLDKVAADRAEKLMVK